MLDSDSQLVVVNRYTCSSISRTSKTMLGSSTPTAPKGNEGPLRNTPPADGKDTPRLFSADLNLKFDRTQS